MTILSLQFSVKLGSFTQVFMVPISSYKPNSRLIDTIASYNGYGQKNSLCKLTHLLTYLLSYPKGLEDFSANPVTLRGNILRMR